jgi:hypothetical protein
VLEKGQCLDGNIQYYGDYRNTSYSYTPTEDTETEQTENVYGSPKPYELPISAILFIFGTTGSVILIIIIISNKDMRTVPNMYLLSLAISDIIYLTAIFSSAWLESVTWLRGDIVCTFLPFCNRMSVGLTTNFIIVCIFQLYRATVNPFHVRVSSQPAWLATVATIFGAWLVAALVAIPAARSQYMCVNSIFLWRTNYYRYVIIFHLLVSFGFPIFPILAYMTMITPYLAMTQNPRLYKRKKFKHLLLALWVTFFITSYISPFPELLFILNIRLDFSRFKFVDVFVSDYNLRDLIFIQQILLSIKSCLSPVILFFTSLAFRRHFKRYLTCRCKTNSTPNDVELTLIN